MDFDNGRMNYGLTIYFYFRYIFFVFYLLVLSLFLFFYYYWFWITIFFGYCIIRLPGFVYRFFFWTWLTRLFRRVLVSFLRRLGLWRLRIWIRFICSRIRIVAFYLKMIFVIFYLRIWQEKVLISWNIILI